MSYTIDDYRVFPDFPKNLPSPAVTFAITPNALTVKDIQNRGDGKKRLGITPNGLMDKA